MITSPYRLIRRIAPYVTRVAPRVLPALGFAAGIVSTIYLATKYIDSLPGHSSRELEEQKKSGKSIDNRLRD